MAPVLGFEISDVAIRENLLPRLGQNADEWIIRCVDHQRGPRNALDHVPGGRSGVIVFRPGEAAVVGSHAVVEVPERFNSAQTGSIEGVGKQPYFAAKAPKQ